MTRPTLFRCMFERVLLLLCKPCVAPSLQRLIVWTNAFVMGTLREIDKSVLSSSTLWGGTVCRRPRAVFAREYFVLFSYRFFDGAPLIRVPGRMHPVEVRYVPTAADNDIQEVSFCKVVASVRSEKIVFGVP